MTPRERFADALSAAALFAHGEPSPASVLSDAQREHILAAADEYRAAGLRALADDLDGIADHRDIWHDATRQMAAYARKAFREAAELARSRARGDDSQAGGHSPVPSDGRNVSDAHRASQGRGEGSAP